MKLSLWLSIIGIVAGVVGGSMLFRDLGETRGSHLGIYILLSGAALIFVPWAIYGISVVVNLLGSYFR